MSNSSESIPTAILVPKPRRPRKRLPFFDKDVPWVKIAIGGVLAWTAVVVVVALYFSMRPETQRLDEQPLAELPPVPEAPPIIAKAPPKAVLPKPAVDPLAPAPKDDLLDEFDLAPAKGEFVDCKQIGTQVKFMKEPADAFLRAREEKKLVFVMHLSGNLEDPGFT